MREQQQAAMELVLSGRLKFDGNENGDVVGWRLEEFGEEVFKVE